MHNDDEMRAALSRTVALGIEMIATEIIPGADDQFFSYYTYIDEEGEPLLHVTKRKLRQYPIWFGSGCFHATDLGPGGRPSSGCGSSRASGLRGLGNVEFKRDARDGRLKLIECNHRFTAATGLLRAAGRPAAVRLQQAHGPAAAAASTGYDTGPDDVVPDARPARVPRVPPPRRDHVLPWLRSIMRRHHYPVASLSDPRPALVNNLRVFGRIRRAAEPPAGRSRELPGHGVARYGTNIPCVRNRLPAPSWTRIAPELPDRAPLLRPPLRAPAPRRSCRAGRWSRRVVSAVAAQGIG